MQRSGINASFCNTISVYYSYPIHAQTNERLLQSKTAIMELTCHDTEVSVKYRDHEVNVFNFLLYNNYYCDTVNFNELRGERSLESFLSLVACSPNRIQSGSDVVR